MPQNYTVAKIHILLVTGAFIVMARAPALAVEEPDESADEQSYVWEEDYNFGQDPLNPVWRLDLRQSYVSLADSADAFVSTLRLDAIWNLGDKGENGQLYWRNDALFLVGSDAPSIDNPTGEWEYGYGDMLSQAFWILPSDMVKSIPTVDAFGVGMQLEIPSATKDNLGSNQWVLSPAIGAQWLLSKDGTAALTTLLFYSFDIGSTSNARSQTKSIKQIRIQPITTFIVKEYLPIDYITFYDTDQMIIDADNGDVFVPFQVQFGRKISKDTIISLELTKQLFHTGDLDLYDAQVTFRFGKFF